MPLCSFVVTHVSQASTRQNALRGGNRLLCIAPPTQEEVESSAPPSCAARLVPLCALCAHYGHLRPGSHV